MTFLKERKTLFTRIILEKLSEHASQVLLNIGAYEQVTREVM